VDFGKRHWASRTASTPSPLQDGAGVRQPLDTNVGKMAYTKMTATFGKEAQVRPNQIAHYSSDKSF